MASSVFYPSFKSKEVDVTVLFMRADIGATGAPTIDTDDSKGIASISRTAAGDYTITLSEAYNKLLGASVMSLEAGDTEHNWGITAQDVSSAKTVQISNVPGGTPTDPDDGSDLYVTLFLKNSSV
jgi:hypothetical protein